MKILLVEDAEGMRKIVATMLRNMGLDDVVTAENGEDALIVIGQVGIDLVLTNWNMPVMDGLELVRRVRSRSESAQIPVIMFTSRASRQDVVHALKAGVDGYVAKPFTPQQLREQIDQVFLRRAQRQIERITATFGRIRSTDTHPLLLVGDGAILPDELVRPENRPIVRFLDDVATTVGRLAGKSTPPLLAAAAENDSSGVVRLLRNAGERAKMLLLSTRVAGSGLTLARLASVNRRADLNIFLVCEQRSEIPTKVRTGLDRLGVKVFERDQLDAEALEHLTTEYVLAAAVTKRPAELPSPEEIRARLETDIRTTVSLPVMPRVYHDISTLDREPESDIQDWVDAIVADPLSSAQIVRRARSPAYGFRGDVSEADQAVILLGKSAVKEVVVSEAVQRAFKEIQEDNFDIEDFWLHAVSVAITARLLSLPLDESQRTPEQQKDFEQHELDELALAALGRLNAAASLPLGRRQDPFVGGMMHDIGKVALVQSYPGLYPALLTELRRNNWDVPMRFAEETIAGGADHTAVGAILAESWHLGDEIKAVIEQHHEPDPKDALTSIVALANVIAGGIQPYPKSATYPLLRLAADGEPTSPAEVAGDEEGETPPEPLPPQEPATALVAFLPGRLCEALGLSSDDIVSLARVLAPSVRKCTEDLRQSLSS